MAILFSRVNSLPHKTALCGRTVYSLLIVLLLFTLLPSFVSAATTFGTSLTRGLVGYWTFDAGSVVGSTARDLSGRSNAAVITGTATLGAGRRNQSFSFDGSTYLLSTSPIGISGLEPRTISAWVKTTDNSTGRRVIAGWGGAGGTHQSFDLELSNGNVYIGTADEDLSTTYGVGDGKWHHVVATYNGSVDTLYADGSYIDSKTVALSTIDSSFSIGRRDYSQAGDYGLFTGNIDDVRLYNRALSAEEVSQFYKASAVNFTPRAGSSGKFVIQSSKTNRLTSGLVGYWDFDGAHMTPTQALDASGNSNTGTLTGTTRVIGKRGQALLFNGTSDYVATPSMSSIEATAGSVAMWVYATAIDDQRAPLEIGQSTNNGCGGTNSYRFVFYSGNLWFQNAACGPNVQISAALVVNRWHHLVGIWQVNPDSSDDVLRLYVDGLLAIQSSSENLGSSIIDPIVHIGHNRDNPAGYFSGKIDDVRIYNRVLTVGEVKELYNKGR